PDGTPKKTNGRAIAYSTVLVILLGVFTTLLFNRSDIDGTVLRAKGSTYQQRDDGTVSNLFSLELINKTNKPMTFELKPQDPGLQIQLINPVTVLDAGGTAQMSFFLIGDSQRVGTYKTKVNIDVVSENKVVETLKTTFVCPPGKGKSGE